MNLNDAKEFRQTKKKQRKKATEISFEIKSFLSTIRKPKKK